MNLRSTVKSTSNHHRAAINPIMVITDYVPGMVEDLDKKIKYHEDTLQSLIAHREKLSKLLTLAGEL